MFIFVFFETFKFKLINIAPIAPRHRIGMIVQNLVLSHHNHIFHKQNVEVLKFWATFTSTHNHQLGFTLLLNTSTSFSLTKKS